MPACCGRARQNSDTCACHVAGLSPWGYGEVICRRLDPRAFPLGAVGLKILILLPAMIFSTPHAVTYVALCEWITDSRTQCYLSYPPSGHRGGQPRIYQNREFGKSRHTHIADPDSASLETLRLHHHAADPNKLALAPDLSGSARASAPRVQYMILAGLTKRIEFCQARIRYRKRL